MSNFSPPRVDGLDFLRGLAILLVILRHAFPDIFGGAGIVGVIIFFCLSGYLITRILLRDIVIYGRVRYGRFYRNRFLRLIPPLVVFLIGLSAVSLIWNPLQDRGGLIRALVIAITYVGNLPFDVGSPAVSHLWTLATEEQFYLVWPLLLLLAYRHKAMKGLFTGATIVILIGLVLTTIIFAADIARMYGIFTSWAIGLVLGSACAVFGDRFREIIGDHVKGRYMVISIAVVTAASFAPEPKAEWWGYFILGPLVALAGAILVLHFRELTTVAISMRPFIWLGKISYAAYLWNYPLTLWLNSTALPFSSLYAGALTLSVAQLSWWVVERPVAKFRAHLDRRAAAKSSRADSIALRGD